MCLLRVCLYARWEQPKLQQLRKWNGSIYHNVQRKRLKNSIEILKSRMNFFANTHKYTYKLWYTMKEIRFSSNVFIPKSFVWHCFGHFQHLETYFKRVNPLRYHNYRKTTAYSKIAVHVKKVGYLEISQIVLLVKFGRKASLISSQYGQSIHALCFVLTMD